MKQIIVLTEHRQGEIRDISFELLSGGKKLADSIGGNLTAVVLGSGIDAISNEIKKYADKVIVADDPVFENFNSEVYQSALAEIITTEKPFLTLIANTAFGIDLCPALATQLDLPFATDCLDVEIGDELKVIRQMYDGKLNARVALRNSESYIITMRAGSFPTEDLNLNGEVVNAEIAIPAEPDYRKFVEYIEAATGDVDITKSDIVIGIGRGIKEKDNLKIVEDFAEAIGGVVGCSRPIVDADWLPKDRQIGSSGKVIKPKLYIALGISGAFQHTMGMKGAETIVVINKDPNAPIFKEADYGIVDDLFKVLPALQEKILELK